MGYVVDKECIRPDPRKLEAIVKYPTQSSVSDIHCFLGMVNQLAKFIHNITEISIPLRKLLQRDHAWCWDKPQEESFEKL